MKGKVYISGPMTGIQDYNRGAFIEAEKLLRVKGYDAVNPHDIKLEKGSTYEDYMKADIKALLECDYIYMLEGWKESKGACMEYQIAKFLGIKEIIPVFNI